VFRFRGFDAFLELVLLTGLLLNLLAGFAILRRRARLFAMIVAGLDLLAFPFGTALGGVYPDRVDPGRHGGAIRRNRRMKPVRNPSYASEPCL